MYLSSFCLCKTSTIAWKWSDADKLVCKLNFQFEIKTLASHGLDLFQQQNGIHLSAYFTYWNALSKQCCDCLENTDRRAIHLSMTSFSQVLKCFFFFFFSGFSSSWIRWPYSNLNLIKHWIVVMQCKCQELFPIAEWWEAGIRSFTELTNTRNEDDSVKPA